MKSAYELAMERLEKSAPTITLTEEQKAQIAEIDSLYKARIAEKELFLKGKIEEAGLKGTFEELEQLEKQLGVPVLSPLIALAWQAQKRLNIRWPVAGYGRLIAQLP